jgi:hypothetical protein
MQLVAPDILAEARGLPMGTTAGCFAIGLFLWMFGARTHRFWIALSITLAAGLVGLSQGGSYGMQPLVAGLLLAIAAGALALSLVRLLLFLAGGIAALALVHALVPSSDQGVATFLIGGLIGVLLYALWIMTLTSITGTALMLYSSLCLLDNFALLSAVEVSQRNGPLLNWAFAALVVMGVLVQFLLDRRRKRKAKAKAAAAAEEEVEEGPEEVEERPRPRTVKRARPKTRWLGWLQRPKRQAS